MALDTITLVSCPLDGLAPPVDLLFASGEKASGPVGFIAGGAMFWIGGILSGG
jgi:hypothetical protein